MSKIDLIGFTDKNDSYELMYKWCSQKFIYEWFEQRKLSLEEIGNKYKNKLLMNQQHLFFINYNDTKIGFVQIYKYDGKKSDKLRKYDSIFEYDIFIGESEYLSRGIGCEYVIVDVFAYNEIGKKFYNKKNYHTRMETMIKKI